MIKNNIKIFPSLISGQITTCRILNLVHTIKALESYCDGFHLDVMDFKFVPNLTVGPEFINLLAKSTSKQLFLHMMVKDPDQWLNMISLNQGDIYTFHYEATQDHNKIIENIHKKKLLAGLAVSPQTPIESIYNLLQNLDQVLVMSVNPGFSGQAFIPETITKLHKLAAYKFEHNLNFRIAMDGGINEKNIAELAKAGVNDFAISSAIFKSDNPITKLENLYSLVNSDSNYQD